MATDPDAQVSLLHALADPTRLAIVRQLAAEGECCVCDMTVCCNLTQPTVSHHLRVLREAGVVQAERRGTWAYYTLREEAVGELTRLLRELSPPRPLERWSASGAGRRLPVLPPPS
jgi:ArsR family transcriptional regulator